MADIAKQEIKLIAVYARVSTARQEEEGTIETQLSAVREFAEKNDYTIVKEYIDDGWSGDTLIRPQLDQLRQDAKNKIWQAILAYDPDRLARRGAWQELVMEELKEVSVETLFVTVPPPKNDEEMIMYKMRGVFTEYERMKIKERFRLGKMRKVKEGHILVSEAPYGLTYVPKKSKDEQGYYEVNEEEAQILRKIFSLVDQGLTIRGVIRKLQELGIRPRKSKRGVWSTSTLSSILRNKTYIGEAHYGKSYAVVPEHPFNTERYRKMRKSSRRIKSESEWIKIPVTPILDQGLFMRVQERLRTNFELSSRNRKNKYLLVGKVWCSCGNRRGGEGPQRGKHLYYRCTNRIHSFPFPPTCEERGINARIADKMVWQRIAKLMSSPELLMGQINRWLKQRQNKQQGSGVIVQDLRKEVSKFKEQEDRYNKAYGAGLFSIEKLKEYTIPIRERIVGIENQIAKAEVEHGSAEEAMLPKSQEVGVFAAKAKKMLQKLDFEAKRAIIMNVIEKITGSQNELKVCGYIPVEDINYVKHKTIHRHSRAAQRGQINPIPNSDQKAG